MIQYYKIIIQHSARWVSVVGNTCVSLFKRECRASTAAEYFYLCGFAIFTVFLPVLQVGLIITVINRNHVTTFTALSWHGSVPVGHWRDKPHHSSGKKRVNLFVLNNNSRSTQQTCILIFKNIWKRSPSVTVCPLVLVIGISLGEASLRHVIQRMANGWRHHRTRWDFTVIYITF